MSALSKEIKILVGSFAELSHNDQYLLDLARLVRMKAYSPYSNWRVGAAVREKQGRIYIGCNVEVSTYSQTGHAEQAAVYNMISEFGPAARIVAVAVIGGPAGERMPWPPVPQADSPKWEDLAFACGHCLQIIAEFAEPQTPVRLLGIFNGYACQVKLDEAFPVSFQRRHLLVK